MSKYRHLRDDGVWELVENAMDLHKGDIILVEWRGVPELNLMLDEPEKCVLGGEPITIVPYQNLRFSLDVLMKKLEKHQGKNYLGKI